MAKTIVDHLAQLDATIAFHPTEYLLDYRVAVQAYHHLKLYDTPEGLDLLAKQDWHNHMNTRFLNSIPGTVAEEIAMLTYNSNSLKGTAVRPALASRSEEVAGVDLHIIHDSWAKPYPAQVKSQPLPKEQFAFKLEWLGYKSAKRLFVVDPEQWLLLNMDFPTVCVVAREIQKEKGNKTQVTITFEEMKKMYGSHFKVLTFPNKF